jgi:6-phosphogluconolactonase
MDLCWHYARDDADWLKRALRFVTDAEGSAIAQRGAFHLVLAGGGTPRKVYAALAREPHDWARWHVWFGDERCLPADHPERNSRMAAEALLDHVPIPAEQIHLIAGEQGNLAAAADYNRQLAGVGAFDLVLLGLGEDGHTASLFPGQTAGLAADAPDALPVDAAPKPPPQRVSLSARRLGNARRVLYLISGAGKRAALHRWMNGGGEPIPAAQIPCPAGLDALLDPAAAHT